MEKEKGELEYAKKNWNKNLKLQLEALQLDNDYTSNDDADCIYKSEDEIVVDQIPGLNFIFQNMNKYRPSYKIGENGFVPSAFMIDNENGKK